MKQSTFDGSVLARIWPGSWSWGSPGPDLGPDALALGLQRPMADTSLTRS
ncbi:hypothetical protein JYK04_01370 [Streptomyces nojiriensis]|nr:hypothetical protein JYK04_01370 [Streptomyces nojiriensis]